MPCSSTSRTSSASAAGLVAGVTGRCTNGTSKELHSRSASGWLDTTSGISIWSEPVDARNSRSLRQCMCLETMISVRYGACASQSR